MELGQAFLPWELGGNQASSTSAAQVRLGGHCPDADCPDVGSFDQLGSPPAPSNQDHLQSCCSKGTELGIPYSRVMYLKGPCDS